VVLASYPNLLLAMSCLEGTASLGPPRLEEAQATTRPGRQGGEGMVNNYVREDARQKVSGPLTALSGSASPQRQAARLAPCDFRPPPPIWCKMGGF